MIFNLYVRSFFKDVGKLGQKTRGKVRKRTMKVSRQDWASKSRKAVRVVTILGVMGQQVLCSGVVVHPREYTSVCAVYEYAAYDCLYTPCSDCSRKYIIQALALGALVCHGKGPVGICIPNGLINANVVSSFNQLNAGRAFAFASGARSHFMTAATLVMLMEELYTYAFQLQRQLLRCSVYIYTYMSTYLCLSADTSARVYTY
jgi:hypothetical protein